MIKKKIIISALVLTMCVGAALLTSCGRENSTTDGRGEGNQTTQTPNDNGSNSNNGGVIGEIGSDIGEGVGNIVDGVTGNGANGGNNGSTNGSANGSENNGSTAPGNPTTPEGARTRSFPAGK